MSGGGGVAPARVLVIGAGVVGMNAALIARGMGAEVVIIDQSLVALQRAEKELPGVIALFSNRANIIKQVTLADIVIGAVLVPGAAAPKLVTKSMLKKMKPGSILVDVAIDQGGCFATSRSTTHQDPVYVVDRILHYCVANMPGSVPHTATHALNHATLPFVLQLAGGITKALDKNPHLRAGLAIMDGKLTCAATAKSLKMNYCAANSLLH